MSFKAITFMNYDGGAVGGDVAGYLLDKMLL